MRIVSWNVNGLRALVKKPHWKDMVETLQPDVLCLQEVKLSSGSWRDVPLAALDGFTPVELSQSKPGYSGTMTMLRSPRGAGIRKLPAWTERAVHYLGLQREGRCVVTKHIIEGREFYVINAYFPNGGRGPEYVKRKLSFYADMYLFVEEVHAQGHYVVLCGDFNTAYQSIDLKNPRANVGTTGFLPEEREWLTAMLIGNELEDVWRLLHRDHVKYTWWDYRTRARSRNAGWRIDMFYISQACVPFIVADAGIADDILGSDHCPIWVDLG